MTDLVSVIIPAYNREKTIRDSIFSVLEQSYKNIEVLVVDDMSTDGTVEVIKSIHDDRVRLICHEKNRGACAARNTGVKGAKGTFIAFNDSDDLWRPDKLEKQMIAFEERNADVVFCKLERHNYDYGEKVFPNLKEGFVDYITLAVKSKCSTQTIVAKKAVFDEFLFDETLPRMQDYDFVIRVAKTKKFYFVDEGLVDVYLQPNSITTKDIRKRYEICKILYDRHQDVCQKYPEFEIHFLESIGYFQVKLGLDSFPAYSRLYDLNPNLKNLFKKLLSKTGLLKVLWANK